MPFLSRPANRRGTDAASSAIARGTSTICSTPRLQRPTTRASGSRKPGAVSTRLRTATPRLVCGRRRSLLVRCAQCRLRRVADNIRTRSVQPISSCASQGSPTPGASTLEVTAVYATEPSPPENGQALPRMLPCTDVGERAALLVRTEAGRKKFSASSRPELGDRNFDDADALKRCLAFDAIAAWRVFDLDRPAREKPGAPAFQTLSDDDIEALLLLDQRFVSETSAQTARSAVTARLVGFWPAKRQPLPGNEKRGKSKRASARATGNTGAGE